MTRYLFPLLAILTLSAVASFAQKGKIEFKETTYDFGKVQEDGGNISHEFIFTNTGSEPVLLQGVTTSCGCTASEWSHEPILPGKTGYVIATYSPRGRPHSFVKSLTIRSNAENETLALFIKGYVIPHVPTPEEIYRQRFGELGMKSAYIPLQNVNNTGISVENVEVHNFGERPLKLQISNMPPYCEVTPQELKVDPEATATFAISIDGTKCSEWDHQTFPLQVRVDGVTGVINVAFTRVQDFSKMTAQQRADAPIAHFDATTYRFPTVQSGALVQHDFVLTNNGNTPLHILRLHPACSCITAVADNTEVKPGMKTLIHVTFNSAGYRGRQDKRVYLTIDDPDLSSLNLDLIGEVE